MKHQLFLINYLAQLAPHSWPYVGPMWVYWLALHFRSKVSPMKLWPAGQRRPAFFGPLCQYARWTDDACFHRAYFGNSFWANSLLSSDLHWKSILGQYCLLSSAYIRNLLWANIVASLVYVRN